MVEKLNNVTPDDPDAAKAFFTDLEFYTEPW